MNDRYRLPEVLGGAEYESVGKHGDMVGFDFPNFPDRMWLPASVLIKVEPPLEEPRTMGSVVQISVSTTASRSPTRRPSPTKTGEPE